MSDYRGVPVYVGPVVKPQSEEPVPVVDVVSVIKRLRENDPTLRQVNLNNQEKLSADRIEELVEALRHNTKLKSLEMANTRFGDSDSEVCVVYTCVHMCTCVLVCVVCKYVLCYVCKG